MKEKRSKESILAEIRGLLFVAAGVTISTSEMSFSEAWFIKGPAIVFILVVLFVVFKRAKMLASWED